MIEIINDNIYIKNSFIHFIMFMVREFLSKYFLEQHKVPLWQRTIPTSRLHVAIVTNDILFVTLPVYEQRDLLFTVSLISAHTYYYIRPAIVICEHAHNP